MREYIDSNLIVVVVVVFNLCLYFRSDKCLDCNLEYHDAPQE